MNTQLKSDPLSLAGEIEPDFPPNWPAEELKKLTSGLRKVVELCQAGGKIRVGAQSLSHDKVRLFRDNDTPVGLRYSTIQTLLGLGMLRLIQEPIPENGKSFRTFAIFARPGEAAYHNAIEKNRQDEEIAKRNAERRLVEDEWIARCMTACGVTSRIEDSRREAVRVFLIDFQNEAPGF